MRMTIRTFVFLTGLLAFVVALKVAASKAGDVDPILGQRPIVPDEETRLTRESAADLKTVRPPPANPLPKPASMPSSRLVQEHAPPVTRVSTPAAPSTLEEIAATEQEAMKTRGDRTPTTIPSNEYALRQNEPAERREIMVAPSSSIPAPKSKLRGDRLQQALPTNQETLVMGDLRRREQQQIKELRRRAGLN